jgi:hypothetical protein
MTLTLPYATFPVDDGLLVGLEDGGEEASEGHEVILVTYLALVT